MQALLIYKLGNKNHLKNINSQNFAHSMMRLRQRHLRYSMKLYEYDKQQLINEIKTFVQNCEYAYTIIDVSI